MFDEIDMKRMFSSGWWWGYFTGTIVTVPMTILGITAIGLYLN